MRRCGSTALLGYAAASRNQPDKSERMVVIVSQSAAMKSGTNAVGIVPFTLTVRASHDEQRATDSLRLEIF
jgi:hypothetical protein